MFMIIGMVVLGSFGFVFYLSNYISDRELQKKVDRIYSDLVQATPIKLYVSQCVQASLAEGLALIGMQGGIIYSNQTGSILPGLSAHDPENAYYNDGHNGYNVSFAIKSLAGIDELDGNEFHAYLPVYPCNNLLHRIGSCSASSKYAIQVDNEQQNTGQ